MNLAENNFCSEIEAEYKQVFPEDKKDKDEEEADSTIDKGEAEEKDEDKKNIDASTCQNVKCTSEEEKVVESQGETPECHSRRSSGSFLINDKKDNKVHSEALLKKINRNQKDENALGGNEYEKSTQVFDILETKHMTVQRHSDTPEVGVFIDRLIEGDLVSKTKNQTAETVENVVDADQQEYSLTYDSIVLINSATFTYTR